MKELKGLLLISLLIITVFSIAFSHNKSNSDYPIGKPGSVLGYNIKLDKVPASVVNSFTLQLGDTEIKEGITMQWLHLIARKNNGSKYSVALLCSKYPNTKWKDAEADIARYILTTGAQSVEYINQQNKNAVLPNTGAWKHLFPRAANNQNPFNKSSKKVRLLGHEYNLQKKTEAELLNPPTGITIVSLTPDLRIGVPHNKKVKNETRRFDESDYEYVEFTKANYMEMIINGMNVFNVNQEQLKWIQNKNIYYWGPGGNNILYPEDLYRSNYLGPAIFFDEPMVHTRDRALKPKFQKNPSLRKSITPQSYFDAFQHEYHKAKYERSPTVLLKGLAARADVNIGDMDFLQENVYSWETMVSSALYQLSEGGDATPSAIVFEPPGRFSAKRVLPELNMCFDCQIPAGNPKNMIGIIKGFIRGAARVTNKNWGISVYGQVDRSEAFWYMTHAYDHGATQFYYWDSYQLAAVPYSEYLALSNNLREHSKQFPNRDLNKLKKTAETAIVLPVGYNLGHVKMGIGNIGGLPELNMERLNRLGVKYRHVMNNFYIEIERCIRLGIEYDLFWDLSNSELNGYDEVVRIREDGKVTVEKNGQKETYYGARVPQRPEGEPPQLEVTVKKENSNGFTAIARITETTSPVYYTQGADKNGIYNNTYVLWELYGPEEEDYTDFWNDRWNVSVAEKGNTATVELKFRIDKAGNYRLRISTSDIAGRSTAVWKEIRIE